MKLNKVLGALIAMAALTGGLPAQAGVVAMADTAITSFLIKTTSTSIGGPRILDQRDIRITSETRTGNASSSFNGVDGTGPGSSNPASGVIGATVDTKYRCAGPDCGALAGVYGTVENNSTTHISTPAGNFGMGDMYLSGSAIGVDQTNVGASGLTRADTSIMGPTNEGSGNATISNSVGAVLRFTVPASIQAFFDLSYNTFVKAWVDPALPGSQTGSTNASTSYGMTLSQTLNGVTSTVIQFIPSDLNKNFSSNSGDQNQQFASIGAASSNLFTLLVGATYQLSISQTSSSFGSVTSTVPEPGGILLMGLGMFALLMVNRRRMG